MRQVKYNTRVQKVQFEKELHKLCGALTTHVRFRTRSIDDVDGRVEDTLLAAYEAYPNFRGDSCFKTWLFRIADHQIARYYRQNERQNKTFCPYIDINRCASNQPSPEKQHETDCDIRVMKQAISRLTEDQQQVLIWHEIDGWDHAEIARRLDMNKQAVRKTLSRARECLRRRLKKAE